MLSDKNMAFGDGKIMKITLGNFYTSIKFIQESLL